MMSNIIRHIFVYGSLRPDDNSNQTWTKDAVSGLTAQRAKLYNTKLYHDQYACAVFDENDNENDAVSSSLQSQQQKSSSSGKKSNISYIIGYVLSTTNEQLFHQKLQLFDSIEGYHGSANSRHNLYDRAIREIELLEDDDDVGGGSSSSVVKAYVYHRTNTCNMEKCIPSGDWLQR